MASYTLTTTADQELLLEWIVAQYNKQHDTNYDVATYIALRFPELLTPYAAAYQQALQTELLTKFSAADAPTQAAVKSTLGVTI